ncbi:MAG: hypothetical protein JWP87_5309 [Labilithrix sp.]|nr:hypothetical protein [Labilithrix sp.]
MSAAIVRGEQSPQNDQDDEITIERRVKASRVTTRITKVDERLLAIARGELEPDDPFGGLIPIYDDETSAGDDEWFMLDLEPEPPSNDAGLFGRIVPSLRMGPHDLLRLPIAPEDAFFVSQVDGKRTIEELIALCKIDDLDGLEIIDQLLRHGAISLG